MEAVAAALPRTLVGSSTIADQTGTAEFVIGPTHTRLSTRFGSLLTSRGLDEQGPWEMTVGGSLLRQRKEEATQIAMDGWLARRSYLDAFDPRRDKVSCLKWGGVASSVFLEFDLPELGTPTLTFDLASASLREEAHQAPGGLPTRTVFDVWSPREPSGVRWPMTRAATETGEMGLQTYSEARKGLACVPASGALSAATACFSPPPSPAALAWPAQPFHVPFVLVDGAILFHLQLGARTAWATLDSGAEETAVDAATEAGRTFHSLVGMTVGTATHHVEGTLGEIEGVQLGALKTNDLVAIKLGCDACGRLEERRPEVILGLPFFSAAAVRIDYVHHDLAFAQSARSLLSGRSVPTALHVLNRQLVIDAMVAGHSASLLVDTGSANALTLARSWGDANGLPGDAPVAHARYSVGTGEGLSDVTFFRLAHASVGPIVANDFLISSHDWPRGGTLAGLAGNQFFAQCSAIVVDVRERTLWLEPPCTRSSPERKLKWQLVRRESAALARNPWVVGELASGGSAARAGIREGDRLLRVDGKEVQDDLAAVAAADAKPAGTRIQLLVDRSGQRTSVIVTLLKFLESSAPLRP